MTKLRFARWKREGLRQFTEDYVVFKGLLNRVRVDLVCTCLKFGIWIPINRERKPAMAYLAESL
jgi:hypothetical protein